MQLWKCGHTELRPGVGPAGLCRIVVIDLENQAAAQDRRYRGTMANPQSLPNDQVEVTWTEGGAVQIIGTDMGSTAPQRWRWSQRHLIWEEGGCPPDKILRAILSAMG
jgi:hypothetical protein